MLGLAAEIREAVTAIRKHWDGKPRAGIILGTGLGGLAGQIDTQAALDYFSRHGYIDTETSESQQQTLF